MASIGASLDVAATSVGTRSLPLSATVFSDWSAAEPRWKRLTAAGAALPFQRAAWLRTWYRHCSGGRVEPVVVLLRDAADTDVLGLALVRQREGATRVITFADGGLTDYNAPALGNNLAPDLDGRMLWSAIRRALPPADLVRFAKMPLAIDGRANPLATLPGTQPSSLTGNVLHVPGTWESWRKGLKRHFRKEIGRVGRIFDAHTGSGFRRYEAGDAAEQAYARLEALQKARIEDLGLPYILDREPARGFYRDVMRNGLRDGTALLTALTIGDEVIAALLGITDGMHYAMTRLATPGAQFRQFSPGLVLIERTLKMLHGEGFRDFDFTIGDYTYKRRLGVTSYPLVEMTRALTPLGWPAASVAHFKNAVRRHPALTALLRRMRDGRPEEELDGS